MEEQTFDDTQADISNEQVYDSVFWTEANMLPEYLPPLVQRIQNN